MTKSKDLSVQQISLMSTFSMDIENYAEKDTVVTNAYGTEVKQGRGPRQEQQTGQQINPREEPNWQTPHHSPSRHLATVCCEQCQQGGRVAAHSGRFTPDHKEHQGVDGGQ